ncbi:HLA class II histocompatibility antigen, DRB1 beta chain [Saguinus oedipus]|uniref:HLA class II histocompatibility antigen, DRB1 beta chain n=1 Tax=Saguinus oedipus TaxID=9490 RepID=A0ABQ9VZD0_SAGOE|nr:HLA class II histocompatibility antigen, DRB1 beta chain [Saguinus oedipus]
MGEFRAVTERGRPVAEYFNSLKDYVEQERAAVDTVCRHNYRISERFLVPRRGLCGEVTREVAAGAGGGGDLDCPGSLEMQEGKCEVYKDDKQVASGAPKCDEPSHIQPKVTVYPAKTQPLQHHNLLVCSVSGFYPGSIEVKWFRNDQEEKAGVVSTGLIHNGDWTFQTLVMLETVPQSGEVYTCQVEHPSVTSPLTVQWRAQSESAQSKMLSGVGGFVLGLLFLGAGLFIYFRNQKETDLVSLECGRGDKAQVRNNGKDFRIQICDQAIYTKTPPLHLEKTCALL